MPEMFLKKVNITYFSKPYNEIISGSIACIKALAANDNNPDLEIGEICDLCGSFYDDRYGDRIDYTLNDVLTETGDTEPEDRRVDTVKVDVCCHCARENRS